MLKDALRELETISKPVGVHPDLVQGGGGNTSVKIDQELMAIKASGYRLDQVTEDDGFAVLNYRNIVEYFKTAQITPDVDYEEAGAELVKQNTIKLEGYKALRPSVEAGFHSILKKYVIHTHPVYANMLCCAKEGEGFVEKIFKANGLHCVWIPYTMPGFHLTLSIKRTIDCYMDEHGVFPQVVFMQNHGLIVTSDDVQECIRLNSTVNDMIKDYFNISAPYPAIRLEKVNDSEFISRTDFVQDFIKANPVNMDFFKKVLYPDQIVYLGDEQIAIDRTDSKINIDTCTGKVVYKARYAEARTIEETLTAYLYVVYHIRKNGLELNPMTDEDIDRIKNWGAEKYRKKMVSEAE
ncbi:class II aldolase/adducin family protein [Caldicoprobacter faecalis]|uniref:Rhamnose utilisation protein RhaD, predicted bifunctional aldolase and dehydrogenase n=1 Tax=Caldicoprobacter faecalis TaxID=937334 RepID=A0A1I5S9P9_9FIRM|nr:class II aldolase/adducin family protein [Caldicoprobacter faecalis]SFP67443.1 Rhamnose utilisation protein RhaD, predicted bifunctional aldolase and dehydrogenase [Caldicoprobacter faecalis]